MPAAPFPSLRFRANGASVSQRGAFGAARKERRALPLFRAAGREIKSHRRGGGR